MRPLRKIITDKLRYKYYSITQSETQLCVRVLAITKFNDRPVSLQQVLSVQPLLGCTFVSNDTIYQVIAEGIFDITKGVHKYWWTPGSNIMFYVTRESIANGIVEICQKGGCTIGTKENSAELGHRLRHITFAQVWCRNSNDKIPECAKSITIDTKGAQFINFDVSDGDECTANFVNTVTGASAYLNIQLHLRGPKQVTPNTLFTCEVFVTCDIDSKLATECSGIFYLEAIDGYLPSSQVQVVNGIGKFTACALLLNPGETMRIKIGTKTYSSKAELIIPIVEVINDTDKK